MFYIYVYCGHGRNPHSNQDIQVNIESYYIILKRWIKIEFRGRRMDFFSVTFDYFSSYTLHIQSQEEIEWVCF